MLNVKDLARLLRVSTKTIYRRIKSGYIPRYYIQVIGGEFGRRGCSYRIYPEAVNLFRATNTTDEQRNSMDYLRSKKIV